MWVEGTQYQRVFQGPNGGEVWEPLQVSASIIGLSEIPKPLVIKSETVGSSVVRTTDQSSAFRTNRGGSVIR